jgi:hypothetical protein
LKDYGEASAVHAATVLAALPGLVLAALLFAGLALLAALLLLTGLLATLLMLRLLSALLRVALLRVALLRVALLLLVTPRIVLLLVRHGTLSSDFVGWHRQMRPPARTITRERRPGSAFGCGICVQRIEIFGKTGPWRGRGVAARGRPC